MNKTPDGQPRTMAFPEVSANAPARSLDDPRVIEAVEAYFAALEAGEKPDRHAFLASYPDVAEALAACLDNLEFIRTAAPQLYAAPVLGRADLADSPSDVPLGVPLGDFRLLREIGRGGMGVVYEAEQLSLNRRVALKVLPFAAGLDSKQLQRFKNEAQAAAHLHHTNIVPVYAVGCERSVHYYAMQFIDGQSLAAMIQELRQQAGLAATSDTASVSAAALAKELASGRWAPAKRGLVDAEATAPYGALPPAAEAPAAETLQSVVPAPSTDASIKSPAFFRTVANLGVMAAEALEHAHQLGVVHRDIKPGNLLVDARGNLWVTDFGLAHVHSQAGLTMTGDLVGTLRYMSPEQALAKRVIVDHRTDIYSLGATLYELLTLEPVFPGSDRQELLRQIAFEEPRPPRRVNKAIPAELETIVLKAMEKNPADRYGTSQELADDLRRHLGDKAILAKRPSLAQRTRRWGRRHKPVVWSVAVSAVVLLILAVVGLTVSNLRIAHEQALTKVQRDEAEANFRKARQAVDDQFTLVSQSTLFEAPGLQPLRKDLLERALKYYLDFLEQRPDDPELQAEIAAAHLRLYQIHEAIEGPYNPGAMQQLEKGVEIVEQLLREQGRDARLYLRLAGFTKGGRPLYGVYIAPAAQPPAFVLIPLFQRIANIWEDFVQDNPAEVGFRSDLATFYFALQEWQASVGQPAEAMANIRKSLAIREKLARQNPKAHEYRSQLAETHQSFALRLQQTGPPDAVENHFYRALELRQELADECRDVPHYRLMLAVSLKDCGDWLGRTGRPKEAEETYRKGLIVQEELVVEFPQTPVYRHILAAIYESLGHVLRDAGKTDKAEKAYREALKNWNVLAEKFPTNFNYRVPYSSFCLCLLLEASHRDEEADRIFRKVLDFKPDTPDGQNYLAWVLAARPYPRFSDPKRALELAKKAIQQAPDAGYIWNTLGLAHYRNGNWPEAVEALEKSMQLGSGGDSFDRFLLAMTHWRLGDKEQARKWYSLAVQWTEKNEQHALDEDLRQDLTRIHAEAAELLGIKDPPTTKEREQPDGKEPRR
jgi:eukaryotic-like serine/threonine-protein kinase